MLQYLGTQEQSRQSKKKVIDTKTYKLSSGDDGINQCK